VYTVRTRSGTGRVPGRVLPRTACVHGRVRDTDGPCAWPVYGRLHSLYTAEGGRTQSVHGRPCRVQTMYTTMHGPCTWSVRDRVNGRVYGRVDGRVYGPCARRCTYREYGRVHGCSRRVRTVYTGVQGPCTWCVHGRIQSTPTRSCTLYMTVFTARVHGRPRPCTDCVHDRARITYMVRP